jgi:hypothetical protein
MEKNSSGAVSPTITTRQPIQWLQRTIAAAIKTFLLSALALACLYFASPEATKGAIQNLRSFTPEMMYKLIEDAMNQCVPGPEKPLPDLSGDPYPNTLKLSKDLGPSACRVSPYKEGDENWPTLGHWVAWLDQHSVPRLPLISPMIAMADVGLHLWFAPSIPTKFLALTQLLFGFGITAAILRMLDRWLNEYSFGFLLFFGTLIIGSAIGWLLLIVIGNLLDGMEALVRSSVLKFILASASALTGMGFITRQLLEWSSDKAEDKATDSLADKAADLLLRYIV